MKDHIAVCICTFRRNKMLECLLRKIAIQETEDLFEFSVVVVDNDPDGLARLIVMKVAEELGLDVRYGIETERTIPAARNHALKLSQGNYIAIIDDDEFPPKQWLITLYRAIQTFEVDGGLGPVHPFFSQRPPEWLIKGNFCERPVIRTGVLLHWTQTRTGNVLLKKEVFDKHHLRFNLLYKTGGSDQEFFMRAMAAGCRFVAVEEAPVYENIPENRWKKSYYLRRALINGYNAHQYRKGKTSLLNRLVVILKSTIAFVVYTLALPLCMLVGTHLLIMCMEKGCHHLSRLFAFFGVELVKKRNL